VIVVTMDVYTSNCDNVKTL